MCENLEAVIGLSDMDDLITTILITPTNKNIHHSFLKLKLTSSNCLFCLTNNLKPKDTESQLYKR